MTSYVHQAYFEASWRLIFRKFDHSIEIVVDFFQDLITLALKTRVATGLRKGLFEVTVS